MTYPFDYILFSPLENTIDRDMLDPGVTLGVSNHDRSMLIPRLVLSITVIAKVLAWSCDSDLTMEYMEIYIAY